MNVISILNSYGLSIPDAYNTLAPFVKFVIGMVIYAILIFRLYRFIAKKDIFKLKLGEQIEGEKVKERPLKCFLFYSFKYIFLFPLVAFIGFLFLSALLVFLAKNQDVSNILFISMATVSAIRITSYYNEDLSRDLAKMLPLALLGVFLVDSSYFSISTSTEKVMEFQGMWETVVYYLLFIIVLEFILRIGNGMVARLTSNKAEPTSKSANDQNPNSQDT